MARPPEGHNLTRLCQGQIANDMYNSLRWPFFIQEAFLATDYNM